MVTLISSYYDRDTHTNPPSSTMVINTSYSLSNNTGVGTLVSHIVQSVLKARMGSDYYCIQPHHPTTPNCYLTFTEQTLPPMTSTWQLLIGITYQQTLLERWIIHWSPTVTTTTTTTTTTTGITNNDNDALLRLVNTHIQMLPLANLLARINQTRIGFIITMNDHHPGCHSSSLNDGSSLDFNSKEGLTRNHIGTMEDQIGQLGVKVVYDEHIDRIHTETKPPFHLSPSILSTSTIGKRRLSRLSLSALDDETDLRNDDIMTSQPLTIPSSTSPIQYTHHGHILAYSTCPSTTYLHNRRSSIPIQQQQQQQQQQQYHHHNHHHHHHHHHHGLAGSYEESLLSGRMSTLQPSKPIWFSAHIGVIGHGRVKSTLRCPPHRSVVFPAYFYNNNNNNNDNTNGQDGMDSVPEISNQCTPPPPFVGTMDLTIDQEKGDPSPGYRIPSKGQLQITIKNPNKFLVKLFLVTYDVSSMPRNTKTFLRQKAYSQSSPSALKYAVHLQFCRTDKNRVYLYNQVRVVFVNRTLDSREQLLVVCEGPKEPVYSPLA